jgi:YVTN family beta-propeller protein
MKQYLFLSIGLLILKSGIFAQTLQDFEKNRIELPNSWGLTPIGKSLNLGDLPLNMAVSDSKKYLAVTNNGQSKQSLQIIDVKRKEIIFEKPIGRAWVGLKFSHKDKYLYSSGGNDNCVLRYQFKNDSVALLDSFILGEKWPNKISPAGLDIDEKKDILYVVTKDNNSLYCIDIKTKNILRQIALPGEAYTCILSNNSKELYISCWGCSKLLVYNTESAIITHQISVGSNPNDMSLSKKNKYLYVANANDNSVSVVNLENYKVLETLNCALYPNSLMGSTTNSVCLSENDKILIIANADNNCLSVFDVSTPGQSKSKGFIPTGWYPTSVKIVCNTIFVANGKGFTSLANPDGPNPVNKKIKLSYQKGDPEKPKTVQYIGGLFKGTMSILEMPNDEKLNLYSQLVYKNTPYSKEIETIADGQNGNPIPRSLGDSSPIKYVFYIVKENRTYDQVLSDIKGGNGDTSLLLFGENITPNQHAIAKEFVLLDNFYVNGEVSADGHNWTMGAYANDYLEKTWVTSYGGRGGDYDGEGNRPIANNKNGFLWDHAARAGVSYRTYGEFADNFKANIPILENHFCPYYSSWDESVRDTTRVGQWKRDFDSLLSIDKLPQLNTLRLINDHTEGLRLGKPTPFAHVADNDLAVGMFVDYLSKSKVWEQSAIFIVEDDAQDGPDHVDAHRTTAYLAGGFVKRNFIDHTMYSTSSMLRTIELILGIPPMTQHDAAATPMWRCFDSIPNLTPFNLMPLQTDINAKNISTGYWQQKSEAFDFSKEDRINDREFSEVIWKAVKGEHSELPSPKRAAFVKTTDIDLD